jgi:hypothetical protein
MKFKIVCKSITKNEGHKMNKHVYLTALIITGLVVSGCASLFPNHGKVKNLTGDRKKDITIHTLIEHWEDYDIYYAGLSVKTPLGIMFDPKDNNIKLTGDRWKKIVDQKTLIETTGWIYPATQEYPWIAELSGPNDQFLGYLYYSGGPASLKKIDDSTFYVFDLENPDENKGAF